MLHGKFIRVAIAFAAFSLFAVTLGSTTDPGGYSPKYAQKNEFDASQNEFALSPSTTRLNDKVLVQFVINEDFTFTEEFEYQDKEFQKDLKDDKEFNKIHDGQFETNSGDSGYQRILKSPARSEERKDVNADDFLDLEKEQGIEFWDFEQNTISKAQNSLLDEKTITLLDNFDERDALLKPETDLEEKHIDPFGSSLNWDLFSPLIHPETHNSVEEKGKLEIKQDRHQEMDVQDMMLTEIQSSPLSCLVDIDLNVEEEKRLVLETVDTNRAKEEIILDSSEIIQNQSLHVINISKTTLLPISTFNPNASNVNSSSRQNFFSQSFFIQNDRGFDDAIALGFESEDHTLIRGSHGVLITPHGVLVSYSVKQNDWQMPNVWKTNCPTELITKIKNSQLDDVYKAMSGRIQKSLASTRLESLNYKKNLEILWITALEDGNLVYTNQLDKLYRVFILDDGKLDELIETTGNGKFLDIVSEGTQFIIMISSFAVELIEVVIGYKGHTTKVLYNRINSKINEWRGQEPKLLILKLKKEKKDEYPLFQSNSKHIAQEDESRHQIILADDDTKLKHAQFKSMSEISNKTKSLHPPKCTKPHGSFPWCPDFFNSKDSEFAEIMTLNMEARCRKETGKRLTLMKEKSPGIMVTNIGLLVSYLIKDVSWDFPKAFNLSSYSKKLVKRITNSRVTEMCRQLSRRAEKKYKSLNTFSCKQNVPLLWAQLLENGNIAYTNRLESLYQLYILDNGELTMLVGSKDKAETYMPSPLGSKFLILISSVTADAVNAALNHKGNDITKLFNLLWNKIKRKYKKESELMIIKMKRDESTCQIKDINVQKSTETVTFKDVRLESEKKVPVKKKRAIHVVGKLTEESKNSPFCPEFFIKKDSNFVDIMTLKMQDYIQSMTNTRLVVMKEGLPGIMVTHIGLLISYSVKQDSWDIPTILEHPPYPSGLIERMSKHTLSKICQLLSSRCSNQVKKFDALSYAKQLPIAWAQFLADGKIAYINQLKDLYKLYILDDAELTELVGSGTCPGLYTPSLSKPKFLIAISSIAADAMDTKLDYKGDNTKELYDLLWNKIGKEHGKEHGKESNLMVIRMKNIQLSQSTTN